MDTHMYVHDPMQGILVCKPSRLFFLGRTGGANNSPKKNISDDMQGIVPESEAYAKQQARPQISSSELRRALKDSIDDLTLDEFDGFEATEEIQPKAKQQMFTTFRGNFRNDIPRVVVQPTDNTVASEIILL